MNTLATLTAALPTNVQAAGMVRAESVFTWANNMTTQLQNTLVIAIATIATVGAIWIMIKRKFTAGSIVMAVVVAGGAIWVVVAGVQWSSDLIEETTQASAEVQVAEAHALLAEGLSLR
jgi:hypothetical protein